ncbi:MAG: tRNA preQ1(34) S-adenosylmethionine ribosyltransferase-isomerase QueA [Calditrichaeota bacterium]|nr:tRNA preQ1(34) S-adenosylmethionine ribosyltransferase-isomerase QueA [Calditrichota bacterium]
MDFHPPEFNVFLPPDRIALHPAPVRDQARLLVLDRNLRKVVHIGIVRDLPQFLKGDLVVLNDTRVIPARVQGHKTTGGRVGVLFLAGTYDPATGSVEVLVDHIRRSIPAGTTILLPEDATLRLVRRRDETGWHGVWESAGGRSLLDYLDRNGAPPLPPYIKRPAEDDDRERYQTVYADRETSLAAPTAGLHLTSELLALLSAGGCQIERITLDVGLGTFAPIRSSDLSSHWMQVETYQISDPAAKAISDARTESRRVTAVGTTSVRALEDAASKHSPILPGRGAAGLFIFPPYTFRVVDRLFTNFHRPDSTLLQLVAAFAGWDLINLAYSTAMDEGFRFYSYGDAMLLL